MNYKQMIERARAKGVTSEKAMLAGIESVSEILEEIKHTHPERYWDFMRRAHEDMYGCHYDDEFAKWDVEHMHSADKDGRALTGEYWRKAEILTALQGKVFPSGTTDCDKYVACNAAWHDLHKLFSDEDIIEAAYLFYFADEDAPEGKIWKYMKAMKHDCAE